MTFSWFLLTISLEKRVYAEFHNSAGFFVYTRQVHLLKLELVTKYLQC